MCVYKNEECLLININTYIYSFDVFCVLERGECMLKLL